MPPCSPGSRSTVLPPAPRCTPPPSRASPARDIAAAIGRGLGVPVRSVAAEDATEHFGWLGRFFAADVPASSEVTQRLLDWTPTQPGLIDDLDAGHYFAT